MGRKNGIQVRLWLGIALAILFDTIQQLVWKVGVVAMPETDSPWETLAAAFREPMFALVAILMVLRLINWLKVLELADLSFAQPMTTLSFVTVAIASAVYLGETLTWLQIAGMAVVLAGVWCISQTERDSHESEKPIS